MERRLGMTRGTLFNHQIPLPSERSASRSRVWWMARRLRELGLSIVYGRRLEALRDGQQLLRVDRGIRCDELIRKCDERVADGADAILGLGPRSWQSLEVVTGNDVVELEGTGRDVYRVWTDGSTVKRNDGWACGWGLMCEFGDGSRRRLCGLSDFKCADNNVAELFGVMMAISLVPEESYLRVFTDSAFVISVARKVTGDWGGLSARDRAQLSCFPLVISMRRLLMARTGGFSIVKVKAHSRELDVKSIGNECADWAARVASKWVPRGSAFASTPWMLSNSGVLIGNRPIISRVDSRIRQWSDLIDLDDLCTKTTRQGALLRRFLHVHMSTIDDDEETDDGGGRGVWSVWCQWRETFGKESASMTRFLGKLFLGTLPTRNIWSRMDESLPIECPFCQSGIETMQHIFVECGSTGFGTWRENVKMSTELLHIVRETWMDGLRGLRRNTEDGPIHTWSNTTRRELDLDTWGPVHCALRLFPPGIPWHSFKVDPKVLASDSSEFLWSIWCARVSIT